MLQTVPSSTGDLVNAAALAAALSAATADSDRPGPQGRARVLAIAKESLGQLRGRIRRRFDQGASGTATVRTYAAGMDRIVVAVADYAAEHVYPAHNPSTGDRFAVIAVGGYGRGELAPASDIDLLFLTPYKKTPRVEQLVEYLLYLLWDMGLKVGHATRSVDECLRLAREDLTIRTSLLECRFLWGERPLADELRRRFDTEVVSGSGIAFVEAKLAERDNRHRRLGDTRYVLEPNVKDGKGGLRDLHTLFWIAKYLYRVDGIDALVERNVFTPYEARRFFKTQDFLQAVRCHLHYVTGRGDDRMTFEVQKEIAQRMGYLDHPGSRGVERFMKHYYLVTKAVSDLTRIFAAAIEADHKTGSRFSLARFWNRERKLAGFGVDGGRLAITDEAAFLKDPVNILRLFHAATVHKVDVHPRAMRFITRHLRLVDGTLRGDVEANRLFLEIMTTPGEAERGLRLLSEAGVLGRFVPPFGRVVAQMQYDMYHVYTVDEHTIRAIGVLDRIERGELNDDAPAASDAIHRVLSRRVLYVALLLHDIAKGMGGDHSILGAEIALELCPRLGLSDEETESVSWLVRHHLVMSNTAFRRDINDPQTVADFVAVIQSPERLRLLLVLTVADIRAVGPQVWNGWKAALLRSLYYRAEELMSGAADASPADTRVRAARDTLRTALAAWPPEDLEAHLARTQPSYLLSYDTDTLVRHARLAREATACVAPLLVDTRVDPARDVTEVTICTHDHPGLFSRIAGAIALAGADIVDARVQTFLDGIALDTFWIQDEGDQAFDESERIARLRTRIEQALAGNFDLRVELGKRPAWQSRTDAFTVPPRVLFHNKASATQTVIEVNGRDRPGLLYDIARALTSLGLQVSTARIATYGERVVDVFYVRDVFGMKVQHEGKLNQIRETLCAAVAGRRWTAQPPAADARSPAAPAAAEPDPAAPEPADSEAVQA